jgi:transketolase
MKTEVMRDVLISEIRDAMEKDRNIFFLSADFGSPALDRLRSDFASRFINVGIAEQNLISIASGMALEGMTVFAYAIAPFLTMRAFEQIRINLALTAQIREVNVNLIGVGAGLSYDVTGPTHHCLEDLALMRLLPNIQLISPSDCSFMRSIAGYSIDVKKPKYIRLDGKAAPRIYPETSEAVFLRGFYQLQEGKEICLISTGYMTHTALRIARSLEEKGIHTGVTDFFLLKDFDRQAAHKALCRYTHVVTLEEGFVSGGGLDGLVHDLLPAKVEKLNLGFRDRYTFEVGDRSYLHGISGLSDADICAAVEGLMGRDR